MCILCIHTTNYHKLDSDFFITINLLRVLCIANIILEVNTLRKSTGNVNLENAAVILQFFSGKRDDEILIRINREVGLELLH